MLELLEKQATSSRREVASVQPKETVPPSASYTAPTATAFAMQAGTPICVAEPLLRVEAKVMVPRAFRALMAWARAVVKEAAESQVPLNKVAEPRDRFTTFTSGRLFNT